MFQSIHQFIFQFIESEPADTIAGEKGHATQQLYDNYVLCGTEYNVVSMCTCVLLLYTGHLIGYMFSLLKRAQLHLLAFRDR